MADKSIPGVMLGYEPGAKGYHIYDPAKDRLMIARDVIFDEKRPWNWESSRAGSGAPAPYTFMVQFPDTIHGPIIDPDSELDANSFSGALSPATSAGSIPP